MHNPPSLHPHRLVILGPILFGAPPSHESNFLGVEELDSKDFNPNFWEVFVVAFMVKEARTEIKEECYPSVSTLLSA